MIAIAIHCPDLSHAGKCFALEIWLQLLYSWEAGDHDVQWSMLVREPEVMSADIDAFGPKPWVVSILRSLDILLGCQGSSKKAWIKVQVDGDLQIWCQFPNWVQVWPWLAQHDVQPLWASAMWSRNNIGERDSERLLDRMFRNLVNSSVQVHWIHVFHNSATVCVFMNVQLVALIQQNKHWYALAGPMHNRPHAKQFELSGKHFECPLKAFCCPCQLNQEPIHDSFGNQFQSWTQNRLRCLWQLPVLGVLKL